MTTWTSDELDTIGTADELEIAPNLELQLVRRGPRVPPLDGVGDQR